MKAPKLKWRFRAHIYYVCEGNRSSGYNYVRGLSYQCDKVELKVDGAPKCPRCQQRVYFNEEKKAAGRTWHTRCFNCSKCRKSLDSTNYNQYGDDELLCTGCYRKVTRTSTQGLSGGGATRGSFDQTAAENKSAIGHQMSLATPSETSTTDLDSCPRCGRRVYFAEEVKILRRKWHRMCFKCQSCQKMLEPGRFSEHEEELFCQPCYGKLYGPRGFGYSGGNGSIMNCETMSPGLQRNSWHLQEFDQILPAPRNTVSVSELQNEAYQTELAKSVQVTDQSEPIKGVHEWTESFYIGNSG